MRTQVTSWCSYSSNIHTPFVGHSGNNAHHRYARKPRDIKYIHINVDVYPSWKMLQGLRFKIPFCLVKTVIWEVRNESTILFPSYVVNYLCFGPEAIPHCTTIYCLIFYFRFSIVCLKPWERGFRRRVNRQEYKFDFSVFPFKSLFIHL